MLRHTISSAVLYSLGAFFFYPWKPLMQAIDGDSYLTSYRYFRRDHTDVTNLALHCVALVWQLGGNFALLFELDNLALPLLHVHGLGLLASLRPISTATALLWIATLVVSGAPTTISCISSLAIGSAYLAAPYLDAHSFEVCCMGAFVGVLALLSFALDRSVHRKAPLSGAARDVLHAIGVLGIFLAMRLCARLGRGTLTTEVSKRNANVALLLFMLALASLPKPVVPCAVGGALAARICGELIAQDALLFYGCAFVAQISQGIAHDVSKQKATLLRHEDDREVKVTGDGATDGGTRQQTLGFEWAHVVYFPSLLLQSVHQSLTGKAAWND